MRISRIVVSAILAVNATSLSLLDKASLTSLHTPSPTNNPATLVSKISEDKDNKSLHVQPQVSCMCDCTCIHKWEFGLEALLAVISDVIGAGVAIGQFALFVYHVV
ncbi:hypothetical protein Vi05172_g9086 [Venturia inaequalis]|nr:hypothetical protein Vi05172_g9086 [Venturia inaequalis]